MPQYNVKPPADMKQFAPQLQPGWHRVKVKKAIPQPKYGSTLLILGNDNGECAEFVPNDPREGNPKAWIFWRFLGGCDFPSPDYWEKDPGDREELPLDTDEIFDDLIEQGAECLVLTEDKYKDDGERKARVKQLCSVRRNPPVKLEPGESHLLEQSGEAGGSGPNEDEVPF